MFVRGHAIMHVFIHGRRITRTVCIFVPSLFSVALLGIGLQGGWSSCFFPDNTYMVGFCKLLFCFTRCISTPCIFAWAVLSDVSNLDNHLRDPIRSWGSFSFSMSPTFLKGVLKWSGTIQQVSLTGNIRANCWDFPSAQSLWRAPILSPGFYFTPILYGGFLQGFTCPKMFPVFSGIRNSRRDCSSTASIVLGSLHPAFFYSC